MKEFFKKRRWNLYSLSLETLKAKEMAQNFLRPHAIEMILPRSLGFAMLARAMPTVYHILACVVYTVNSRAHHVRHRKYALSIMPLSIAIALVEPSMVKASKTFIFERVSLFSFSSSVCIRLLYLHIWQFKLYHWVYDLWIG